MSTMPSHTIGCFSWLRRKKSKSQSGRPLPVEKNLQPQDLQVVPSTSTYAFEAGKQTIQILQGFGKSLPVPCANVVLELALLLMTTYEDVNLIEQQVKQLNNRIGSLMLVMVNELNGKKPMDISADVLDDIERLGRDLTVIQGTLKKIVSQNRLLLVLFKSVNQSAVAECLNRLNDSLQTFQVARSIHDGNTLSEIQTRLQKVFETTEQMKREIHDLHSWMTPRNTHAATEFFLEEMPVPLAHVYGRDKETNKIVHILTTIDKPRVVIHGPGGMGKTSVAVSVMENEAVGKRYNESHRFWVPCIGAKTPRIFVDILSKSLRVTQQTGNPLKDVLSALKASKEPRLILLDNFETAWSLQDDLTDGGRISVEHILGLLASISHVAILITIRTNTLLSDTIDWTLIPLEGVTCEDARDIFTNICPSSAHDLPALDQLLEALGYMPYAVTLLAKQAAKSGSSPSVQLEEWQRHGPNSLSRELKEKMNTSIAYSVQSASMLENPEAQTLLAILHQLPSGTIGEHLKWWAHSIDNLSGAIATLSDTALITQHQDASTTYFVLPVVQSYLHEQSRYNSPHTRSLVLTACSNFVLDHKSSPGDDCFKEHQDALTMERNNILSIFLAVSMASILELIEVPVLRAMLAFCWFQFWKKRSTELLKHILRLLSDDDPRNLRYAAEARFCLGKMYIKLGRYIEACSELEAARACFRKLGTPSDIICAGESALELAVARGFMQKSGHHIMNLINEAQADLKDDPKGAARAAMELGYNYWYMQMRTEALEHLKIAKDALQKLNCTAEVAHCSFLISRCHASMKALPEWLSAAQDSVAASRRVGMNDLIAQGLRSLSRCHIVLEQYDDALVALKEAFTISEDLGHPLAIAQVLELSGYAYAKKQDFIGAQKAYEEARKVYGDMEETPQTKKSEDMCRRNIRLISARISESDPAGNVELERPMLY